MAENNMDLIALIDARGGSNVAGESIGPAHCRIYNGLNGINGTNLCKICTGRTNGDCLNTKLPLLRLTWKKFLSQTACPKVPAFIGHRQTCKLTE